MCQSSTVISCSFQQLALFFSYTGEQDYDTCSSVFSYRDNHIRYEKGKQEASHLGLLVMAKAWSVNQFLISLIVQLKFVEAFDGDEKSGGFIYCIQTNCIFLVIKSINLYRVKSVCRYSNLCHIIYKSPKTGFLRRKFDIVSMERSISTAK